MNKILLAFFILVNVVSIFGVQMKWHKNFTIPQAPTAPFSWDNCGAASDPILIKQLSVQPSPIMIGNPVVVGALVALSREIKAPGNSISLTLEKKIFGVWTEIPCIDNIGSCTYDNACDLVPLVVQPICPELTKLGIPCDCPFPPKTYSVPDGTSFPTQNPGNLPSWLTNGDYYVKAQLTDSSNNRLGCYEFYTSLSVPSV